MAKSRNFFEQRKPETRLRTMLSRRQSSAPVAVKQIRSRVKGDFFYMPHFKLQEKCPPSRALRLREVLHCEPGQATAWGPASPREMLRQVLALARANIPGALHVWWGW